LQPVMQTARNFQGTGAALSNQFSLV